MNGMKLGVLKSRVIEAASAAALQSAIDTFLSGFGTPATKEERFVAFNYFVLDGTHYSVCIIYSE